VKIKRTEWIRIELKNLIKISKIRKRMNPPIPLVMRIIILLIGGWNPFNVSLGIRIFILKSIGGQTIFDSHWFLKDEEAMDWKEKFPQFPLDKGNKLKEGS